MPWLGLPFVCSTSAVRSPRYKHRSKARRYHKGLRAGPNRSCLRQSLGPRRGRVEPTLYGLGDARQRSSVGSIDSSEDSQPVESSPGSCFAPLSCSSLYAPNRGKQPSVFPAVNRGSLVLFLRRRITIILQNVQSRSQPFSHLGAISMIPAPPSPFRYLRLCSRPTPSPRNQAWLEIVRISG